MATEAVKFNFTCYFDVKEYIEDGYIHPKILEMGIDGVFYGKYSFEEFRSSVVQGIGKLMKEVGLEIKLGTDQDNVTDLNSLKAYLAGKCKEMEENRETHVFGFVIHTPSDYIKMEEDIMSIKSKLARKRHDNSSK